MTDDQRAMLRLLAQREQGYEDIAALMGLSVEEVRAKVKEALAEVDESGEGVAEAPEAPTVEPAKPTEAEQASEPPPASAEKEPLPEKPAEKAPVEPPKPVTPPPPPAMPSPRPRPRIRLPKDQRLLAGCVGGIVAIALILILVIGGGGSSSSSTNTATTPTAGTTGSSQKLTQAVLSPVDGGNAGGRALFGRVKNTVVLQIEANGLEPSAAGHSYTVWLYKSPKLRLPLAATKVGKSGKLAGQYPVPAEVLAYLASGAFDQIDISLTQDSALAASLVAAKKQKSAPAYTGADVLRGKVTGPIAEVKK